MKIDVTIHTSTLIPNDGNDYDEILLANDYCDCLASALSEHFDGAAIDVDWTPGEGKNTYDVDEESNEREADVVRRISEEVYDQMDWDLYVLE